MDLKSVSSFTLQVKDVATSAKFYESLGFRPGNQAAENTTLYLNWFSIVLMPQLHDPESGLRGDGVFINIKVDNADEAHKAMVKLGYKPVSEPHNTTKNSREFMLKDPDGYNLVFFDKK